MCNNSVLYYDGDDYTSFVDSMMETVAAAIFHGCTFSSPPPARHGQILTTLSSILKIDAAQIPPENQGFLTSTGRFVNRVDAMQIAYRAKQSIAYCAGIHCPELYSEDLW